MLHDRAKEREVKKEKTKKPEVNKQEMEIDKKPTETATEPICAPRL